MEDNVTEKEFNNSLKNQFKPLEKNEDIPKDNMEDNVTEKEFNNSLKNQFKPLEKNEDIPKDNMEDNVTEKEFNNSLKNQFKPLEKNEDIPKDNMEDNVTEKEFNNSLKNQFKPLEKNEDIPKEENDHEMPTNGKDKEKKTAVLELFQFHFLYVALLNVVFNIWTYFMHNFPLYPPWKKVQILDSMQINASKTFVTALEKKLGFLYKCKIKTDPIELEHTKPLIVVCIYNTRLCPDVDSALKNVKYPSQLIVVIVHTGTKNNLPEIKSSEILFDYERKNVTFIDMGFDGDIYNCRQNDEAIEKLQKYVKNPSSASTEGSMV
ncbi:hypothetical protein ACF0H5_021638 [Mactra antiquata]